MVFYKSLTPVELSEGYQSGTDDTKEPLMMILMIQKRKGQKFEEEIKKIIISIILGKQLRLFNR